MDSISAQEELSFIKKVIEDSKRILIIDGKNFIFWGILGSIGLLATYLSIITKNYSLINWSWMVLIFFGFVYTIFYYQKKSRTGNSQTFAGKIMNSIWFAMGIAATILGFAGGMSGAIHGIYISPSISTVVGVAYFISGIVYSSKWMTGLSAGWWLGAVIMFVFPGLHSILIMAGMMIFFQIVPGIVLYKKYCAEFSGKVV